MKEIYNFFLQPTEQNSKCKKYIELPSKIQINVTSVQGNILTHFWGDLIHLCRAFIKHNMEY